jgi:hypothetical protein
MLSQQPCCCSSQSNPVQAHPLVSAPVRAELDFIQVPHTVATTALELRWLVEDRRRLVCLLAIKVGQVPREAPVVVSTVPAQQGSRTDSRKMPPCCTTNIGRHTMRRWCWHHALQESWKLGVDWHMDCSQVANKFISLSHACSTVSKKAWTSGVASDVSRQLAKQRQCSK